MILEYHNFVTYRLVFDVWDLPLNNGGGGWERKLGGLPTPGHETGTGWAHRVVSSPLA